MYSADEVDRALALLDAGASISETARQTGASRAAIRAWSRGDRPGEGIGSARRCFRSSVLEGTKRPDQFPALTDFAYGYLLGLYLGDGHLASFPRDVYRLTISLDSAHPMIVRGAEAAVAICMPLNRTRIVVIPRYRMRQVVSLSKHWPCLLPQHGPGPKHRRRIELRSWQREILNAHPWRFLRGLIQSDGSRFMNPSVHPGKTYWYPRYNFTNRSLDIQRLFCEYCDKVGVEWRQMNRWSISIARRKSVALMDQAIGPKR